MPDIPLGSQAFDLTFHPRNSAVYCGLLSGQVKSVSYDHYGNHAVSFSLQLSKKSIRGVTLDGDGARLFAAGKGKAI